MQSAGWKIGVRVRGQGREVYHAFVVREQLMESWLENRFF